MYGFSNAAKENIDNNKITRAYLKVLATSTKPEIIINEKNYLKDIEFSDERYVPNEGFIGQAVAKEVKGNFNNIVQDFSIQDREFELYFGVELQDRTTEYKKYGTFIVQRPPQDNQVNDNTKFTALDYMVKLNKVWENRLPYPTTIRNIFNDLGSQVGMSVMTATFPNESFIVDSNQFEDGTTCRQVLKAIAQVAFSWARIDENNVIQLDFSKSLPIAKELTTDNYFALSKQDEFTPINKVTFAMSQVEGESKSIQDNTSISQNGLNEFVIYDNPFAYTEAKRTSLVANGNVLFGLRYTPMKLDLTGLIYLNCKDRIGVTNADGERFETFVLNHKIKYNGICLDSIESDAKTQAQTKYEFKSEISKKITHTELIVDKAKAEINARVDSVETKVNTATTTANKAAEDLGKLEIKVNDDIKDLQNQIDGNITTWFYEVAPTLTNAPAKDWTTTELKNMHLGDIYYDTKTGYAYRFMLKDGVYSWQKLSDSDIEKALQVAQNAQDTADHKRRVFYNTPVPPYDKGDLWVQGSDGDILRCNTAKTDKQTYAQSDWVKASKYTDDTVANSVKNSAIGTVDVQYALSDSKTTAPISGWQTTAPEWTEGKYMWQKTVTTYINGTVQESKATCIAGAKGKDGTNGTNGKDGTSITIKSTSVTYQASTSGTTTPTGTWSTTVPTVNKGEYLWTKTVVTYSDNKTTTAYSVAYKGTDGTNGTNGTNGKNSYTHIRYSASADGTNFDTNPNGKGYIGIYYGELATAPTDKTKYTWSKYVGKDGTNGTNGKDGKDGNGITSITYFYATTTTQTAPSAQSITSTTIPSLTPTNKYLWQKEVIDFTDTTVADKTTVSLLGVYGDNGATGTGIESITEEYYLSTSKTTQTGGSWGTTPPAWEYGKYIWTRSKIVYKNPSSTVYTTPVCSSEWEAVNEIQVGGRNLALGTKDMKGKTGTTIDSEGFSEGYTTGNGAWNELYYPILSIPASGNPLLNKQICISLDFKTNLDINQFGNIFIGIGVFTNNSRVSDANIAISNYKIVENNLPVNLTNITANKWYRIYYVYKIPDSFSTTGLQYKIQIKTNSAISSDYTIYYKKVKVEIGNKPTDWSPAPEDIDSAIDSIEVGARNLMLRSFKVDAYSRGLSTVDNKDFTYTTSGTISEKGDHWIQHNEPGKWVAKDIGEYMYSIFIDRGVFSTALQLQAAIYRYNSNGELAWNRNVRADAGNTSYCIKLNDGDYLKHIGFYVAETGSNVNFTFRIKVEKGNKATDWSPAPEDIQNQLYEIGKITKSTNGESVLTLTECGDYEFDKFEMYGNTKQEGTPTPINPQEVENVRGWNLFDGEKNPLLQGLWFSNNKISGNNAGWYIIVPIIGGETYFISKKNELIYATTTNEYPSNGVSIVDAWQGESNLKQLSISTSINAKYLFIGLLTGSTQTNENKQKAIEDLQITKGSASKPYQPYRNIGVKVRGKNLFNFSNRIYTSTATSAVTASESGNKITASGGTASHIAFAFNLKKGEIYTISWKNATGFNSVQAQNSSATYFRNYNATGKSTFTATENYLLLTLLSSGTSLSIDDLQIELGNDATIYAEPKQQSFSLPLQRELCEINGKRDTFVNLNGAWYERHYVGKMVLDGSESIITQTNTGFYRYGIVSSNILNDVNNASKIINYSSHFKCITFNNRATDTNDTIYTICNAILNQSAIYFNTRQFSTLDQFKTWLSQNKPVVYYLLAEPEDLKCTDEQTQVLNNIIKAKTYKGTTYVEAESVLSPIFDITYLTDNPLNETYAKMAEIRDIMQNTIQETYISKTSWESDIKIGEESISQYVKKTQNDVTKIQQGLGEYAKTSEVNKTITTAMEDVSTDVSRLLSFQREVETNGVTQVKTSTGFLFNEDGLTIEKTDAKVKSILNEKGLDIQDATGSTNDDLLFAGYDEELGETVVKSKNIKVEKYLTIGLHSRMEDYTDSNGAGTGIFYI